MTTPAQRTPRKAGVTLRDWYAGLALAGILSNPKAITDMGGFNVANIGAAFELADAMLVQRDKLPPAARQRRQS